MNRVRILPWTVLIALLLAACGGTGLPIVNPNGPTSAPTPAIESAPELSFLVAETQRGVEGTAVSITGLYHVFDATNRQVDVCQAQGARSTCRRYPLERELGAQLMVVSVTGTWRNGRVAIADWQVLPLAWAEAISACRQALAAQAARLGQVAWGPLALPPYRESSARFRLDAAALSAFAFEPAGFDPQQAQFILRGKGPLMPEQHPLVTRWALLYCIGNASDLRITHLVATIEGVVEEY
ncbi:MAG: hypothetical protein C4311_13190 [Chloroflexota bacterium]